MRCAFPVAEAEIDESCSRVSTGDLPLSAVRDVKSSHLLGQLNQTIAHGNRFASGAPFRAVFTERSQVFHQRRSHALVFWIIGQQTLICEDRALEITDGVS